ncbi:MAG: ABC transporter substrate-binding protein [Acidobacteriota bacterium]|nr:ABC transporter substrate-binding protein [Blastocatellia bacterium]MDW8411238.1 ABC transporter substrate-binding protein [Acidobacteriota bacterium]
MSTGKYLFVLFCLLGFVVAGIELSSEPVAKPYYLPTTSSHYPREFVDSTGERLLIWRKPMRIVSQTLATDEILLAICDPARIIALSALADNSEYSNVVEEAKAVKGRTNRGAEEVLKMQPDLIFVSSYSRAEFVELLRTAKAPLYKFSSFDTLEDIERNILAIGEVIDERARAEALVESMRQKLASICSALPKRDRPLRVLSYGLSGSTAGRGTLFDDILHRLGAINLSAEHGIKGYAKIGAEQVVAWNPDVIVAGAEPGSIERIKEQMLRDPAIAMTDAARNGRIVVIDNRHFLSVSHHIIKGIEALAVGLR